MKKHKNDIIVAHLIIFFAVILPVLTTVFPTLPNPLSCMGCNHAEQAVRFAENYAFENMSSYRHNLADGVVGDLIDKYGDNNPDMIYIIYYTFNEAYDYGYMDGCEDMNE
ncbi:MAG: hypothetical protein IKS31_01540 [Clostridia bacterium]|nr:hypothetical protein [Clostridia bacterium]